jgi:hypothetical protein
MTAFIINRLVPRVLVIAALATAWPSAAGFKISKEAPNSTGDRLMTTAIIIPFPLASRRAYIAKQAEQMACMSPAAAARYLCHQLKVQADAMRRRGVPEEQIERETRNMEAAIHREFEAIIGEGAA